MSKSTPPQRVWKEGPFLFFRCACGHEQAVNPGMPWCAECRVEYSARGSSVRLHPDRKTARFALAKALIAAGGVAFGRKNGE